MQFASPVLCRLFAEPLPDSTQESAGSRISAAKNSTTEMLKTCEPDSSLEQHHGSMDASLSLGRIRSSDRPQHNAMSRPGRDGIKLNSDASRTVSVMKKTEPVSSESKPDVQGLSTSLSYVDKFNEFLSHGKSA